MLRDRSSRVSGSKTELVQRLQEDDGKATSTKRGKTADSKKANDSKDEANEDVFDYRAICRPDLRYEDEEYDSEDVAAAPRFREREREMMVCDKLRCICEDPATKHPGWTWFISRKALDIVAQFRVEVLLREAEVWDPMQYGDHSGYGFQEVVDNHLVTFNEEIQKKNPSPAALWPILEGFAFNLPDDRAYWFHIDDADGLCETLKILGVAVFSTLKILEEHNLLRADSPVKNIALVLAYLRRNMEDWPGNCGPEYPIDDELKWCDAAIVEAQHRGIEFKRAP
ncbi:hypothetical protein EDD36DRAFT_276661 [Exophiala viscosa]|uniref:SAP domain-containing protein n=1 Tax=Exophiala viscosa TaxID=2486360 RepID=A0AAN6IE22_9EURO|nr:hypothetical protein EDD36DRAFT_276661 [Exophiala viscosa]